MSELLPILCAVTLSLASTNDYRYTSPNTTNLIGRGMGPNASYLVPKAEDIAFLREANAERVCLLRGTESLFYEEDFMLPGGLAPAEGWIYPLFFGFDLCEAFAPSYGKWDMTGYYTWSPKAQFVSPSFAIPDAVYTTEADYKVNGHSTEATLEAFAIPQCAVPLALLHTNAIFVGGIMSTNTIAGAYANVSVPVAVCTNTKDGSIPQSKRVWEILDEGECYRYVSEYTGEREYTYEDSHGRKITDTYYTSYNLGEQPAPPHYYTNDVEALDVFKNAFVECYAKASTPYSYKHNDYGSSNKYTTVILPNFHETRQIQDTVTGGSFDFFAESDFLLHATNYVQQAKCVLLIRASISQTESYDGYTTKAGRIVTTNHYVLTATCDASHVKGRRWRIDFDVLKNISPLFNRVWVASVSFADPDIFWPLQTNLIPQMTSAYHWKKSNLDHIDVYPFLYFEPTFNARIMDDQQPQKVGGK